MKDNVQSSNLASIINAAVLTVGSFVCLFSNTQISKICMEFTVRGGSDVTERQNPLSSTA